MTRVYLEIGPKKVFACSLDWPGWCRIDRSEEAALDRLMDYVPRYRVIAERAGTVFEPDDPVVVATVPGRATTDFGVPYQVPDLDLEPLPGPEAERSVALLRAAWELFDEVAAVSPEELRKGPRGGGRDLTKIVAHVSEAERSYARMVGVRHGPYRSPGDREAMRAELAQVLARPWEPPPVTKWPPRYALRRTVWHVVDHLWEIEDRR
ncbi:DinB family protein [Nonomuraea sp. MG754425]|uniref:DinB family protein n=1 Tax=Nonomuraea sp. MG754425 TaxID=2570319 RepID=UPI001F1DE167|nr:DinB family protein [Nonomuraea sp. MG754425]